jgi:hypothetical protein
LVIRGIGAQAQLPGADQVGQVVGADAVLEQHRALRRGALVVEGVGAPGALHGGVVDAVEALHPDPPALLAVVDGGLLGDQVGLHAVAGGLVEQHPAVARGDHHRHLARRRRPAGEHGDRPPGGVAGDQLGGELVEQLEPLRAAGAVEAGLDDAVAGRHHLDDEARADPLLQGGEPLGVGHLHLLADVAVAGGHLGDGRVEAAGRLVGAAHQLGQGRPLDPGGVDGDRVPHLRFAAAQVADLLLRRLAERGGGHPRRLQQRLDVEAVGVGVGGGGAADHPHPGAAVAACDQLLDPPVLEPDVVGEAVLGVDLGPLPTGGQGGAQHLTDDGVFEHGWLLRDRVTLPAEAGPEAPTL